MEEKDAGGGKIGRWCKKISEEQANCTLCTKMIKFFQNGIKALKSPRESEGHKKASKSTDSVNSLTTYFKPSVQPDTRTDSSAKAELIWCIHSAEQNYSYLSSDHCVSVFSVMFPESTTASSITLGRTHI